MKPLDRNYLLLQFRNYIHTKTGSEFQSFFENIMEKAFPDYTKIRPRGRTGDGGNDGYRKESGIYYQVYAPRTPQINEITAAKKLKDDFNKLRKNWSKISEVKKYYFVFNDKYTGSVHELEEAITSLKIANPNIDFLLLLARSLEEIFFRLSESDILSLGFDIDRRQAIANTYIALERINYELESDNILVALKSIEDVSEIIQFMEDDTLNLEIELLRCKYLIKTEKIDGAKRKYENLSRRFPNDPRPLLYFSELLLNDGRFDDNSDLLQRAEDIDSDHWLLRIEKTIRKLHIGETVDISNLDENSFPEDKRIKAIFYRLYGRILAGQGEKSKAEMFIDKAIQIIPNSISNYIAKLSLINNEIVSSAEIEQRICLSRKLLNQIDDVEKMLSQNIETSKRNNAYIKSLKFEALVMLENTSELEKVAKEVFELLIDCYFDKFTEQILTNVLKWVKLPKKEFCMLQEYLNNSFNKPSDSLSNELVSQYLSHDTLFTDGKKFFSNISNHKYSGFIENLESQNYDEINKIIKENIHFKIIIANTLKGHREFRKQIIENLPEEFNSQKDKLLFKLFYDEEEFDEAFRIMQRLDLSKSNSLEGRLFLDVARRKEAWDFEITLLQKLLEKSQNTHESFMLRLQLFSAYLETGKFTHAIELGSRLIPEDLAENYLNTDNKEALIRNTIFACLERGKVDNLALKQAKRLLVDYPLENPSFEFKVGIGVEVFLRNDEVGNALQSLIEGVKTRKVLSPQEYAKLYFTLSVEIGNRMNINLNPVNSVQKNTFVKFKDKDQWYFIGDENELDALQVNHKNEKYLLLFGKAIGDKVIFENKYGRTNREEEIEFIYPIEKYIFWQSAHHFHKLSNDGDLEGVQLIEVPQHEDSVDPNNLIRLLQDLQTRTEPVFEIYCKSTIPLAVLAQSEGGLVNAIGRIQSEGKGFINFSSGDQEEFKHQKDLANQIIEKSLPFYIDATSALILSETGLISRISQYLSNMKIPQSVLNFLANVADKSTLFPGHSGYMRLAQGKLAFSTIDDQRTELFRTNLFKSIKLIESSPEMINVISKANKVECFSEKLPGELCDACILAQFDNLPILTEDFHYLQMNEWETKKKSPEYFSSFALIRSLYEKGVVDCNEYLTFFYYLSSYRFRFLMFNTSDIEVAIFGDKSISVAKPKNLLLFNFPLTLSEEYGVSFQRALEFLKNAFLKFLVDYTLPINIVEDIFIEIVENLPTEMEKRELGILLLNICLRDIKKIRSPIFDPRYQKVEKQIDLLKQHLKMYTPRTRSLINSNNSLA